MKLKTLVASIALAYSPIYAQTLTQQAFETSEYFRSRALSSVNASTAYSRGYTGKGSKIAILDSGIDKNNPEFEGRILVQRDFTNSGTTQDTAGHGTHVAGIAAAAKNGNPLTTHGIAFDSNLIIGKISTGRFVLSGPMLSGLQWANLAGADVANISANFALSQTNLQAKQIAPGIYSTIYTNKSTLAGGMNPTQWASALGPNMVVVVAAGNDNTAWTGGLSQLAAATDSKGQLILGGKMIVAGNWNEQTMKGFGPNSNMAGHLCMIAVGNVCQDKYRVSDFYLLAGGTGITSVAIQGSNSTGLSTMTGTSMAAPLISGGVAIIHQMWPQLSGANVVKILLTTANKNLPGYNVNTMGQGLMDLDKATQPIGAIKLAGNKLGMKDPGNNPVLITGGSASTSAMAKLMALDDYDRDFYVNPKAFMAHKISYEFNPKQAAMPYESRNNYSLFNNYNDRVYAESGPISMAVYLDYNNQLPNMIEMGYSKQYKEVTYKVSYGTFYETSTWLGNSISGFNGIGNNKASSTHYVNFGADKWFNNTNLYANIAHGLTYTNANSENIKKISTVLSYSWTIGLEQKVNNKHSIGLMAYQPVSVYRAGAEINAPVGLDSDFNVITKSYANLAADIKEKRLGVYHKFSYNNLKAFAFLETRQNFKGIEGAKDNAIGLQITKQF